DGSGLRVSGRQRGGSAPHADFAAAVGAPVHRAAPGASGLQPRHVRVAAAGESARARAHPPLRGRHRALRAQPLAHGAGGRARPLQVRRHGAGGDGRRDDLPAHRRAAVPAHVRAARLLLVPAPERARVTLVDYVHEQRWFGGKSLEVTGAEIVDEGVLRDEPRLADALVELRCGDGTHDLCQLLHGGAEYDVIADPSTGTELVSLVRQGAVVPTADGQIAFESFAELPAGPGESSRVLGIEQSNSALVVDDTFFVKVYRRLEAGENPDLEGSRFPPPHGYQHAPRPYGSVSCSR